jgi:hypothetical protein
VQKGVYMRRSARSDANQRQIVDALRRVGARVQHLHAVGGGCPDLLVAYRRRLYLLEVKTSAGVLTEEQAAWWREWMPHADGALHVVRSVNDALRAIGAIT